MLQHALLGQFLSPFQWEDEYVELTLSEGMHGSASYIYKGLLANLPYMLLKRYEYYAVIRSGTYDTSDESVGGLHLRISNIYSVSQYDKGEVIFTKRANTND